MQAHPDDIDGQVPYPISWEPLDGRRACRLRITVPGGYRAPESDWAGIHDKAIAAMNALNSALQPYLKKLKLGN